MPALYQCWRCIEYAFYAIEDFFSIKKNQMTYDQQRKTQKSRDRTKTKYLDVSNTRVVLSCTFYFFCTRKVETTIPSDLQEKINHWDICVTFACGPRARRGEGCLLIPFKCMCVFVCCSRNCIVIFLVVVVLLQVKWNKNTPEHTDINPKC